MFSRLLWPVEVHWWWLRKTLCCLITYRCECPRGSPPPLENVQRWKAASRWKALLNRCEKCFVTKTFYLSLPFKTTATSLQPKKKKKGFEHLLGTGRWQQWGWVARLVLCTVPTRWHSQTAFCSGSGVHLSVLSFKQNAAVFFEK